jgi:hypothetical protein
MHSGSWILSGFLEVEVGQVGWMPWRNQESTFVGLARERKVIQPPASPDREEADELLGDLGACDGLFQVLTMFTMYDILTHTHTYI